MTVEQAAAELIRSIGFEQMAKDVEDGKQTAARTIDYLRHSRLTPKHALPALDRAQQLVGPRKVTREEVRAYVEGRGKLPGRRLT